MKELQRIAAWLAEAMPHELGCVDSLPGPTFKVGGRRQVSFSTNNYLALSASRRMIAAARGGLERYGVGNCESRLLGGKSLLGPRFHGNGESWSALRQRPA